MLSCPSCGQQNPEGFRFCGVCGAPLVPTPGREVRKTVTVLFADVTGSTALGERLDPESLRRVMSRFFEEMKGVLERHGGMVEKFIGDAVMAVFGVPTLHEDDALRALHAASAMRERLVSLNAELERDFGVRLDARIGVNTGEVVTGEAESGERLVTGDAVNVAARLEQAATSGEILLGVQTLELARGAVEVEPVEPLPLKGKADPVSAYRLVRVLEGAPAFERRLDAPLVGRREELARVRGAFDQAVLGRSCRLVTVIGPPGIGKSRLALEVADALHGEADVLSGRCLPYGEGITFWPLREIFVAAGAEDELDAALAAGAPEEIVWAVRKALEARARERPLVLVVEDIHWAEPTLLDLIDHLADWTRDAPILLLCSARPELLDARPAWGAGRQNAETLTLEPLDESEADELIESRLGGVQLEEEARARIRRVAEGNPLFVEQLLAMLAEGGDADRVPPTMHALLGARLDALPGDERDLLERAAVVGLEFEWEALGELAPDGRRPPGGQLAALVRKELIRPHELIEDTFRFRHMLIRDAAYARIPKGLRSDLHERFAGWLDGRGEEFEEIVGYHLEQAYRCVAELGPAGHRAQTLAEQAAERLAAPGRRAYARDDMHAASNLLERATALLPADDRRRLELLPSLGRALTEAAEMERAESVLSEAVERGRATGERAVTAYGAVARLNLRLFTTPQKSYEESSLEVEEAIRVFEEVGDAAGTARALGVRGMFRLWQGGTEAAIKDLERAAQYAHQVDDRPHEADILRYVLVAILFGPTPVEDALERVEDIRSRTGTNRTLEVTLLRTRGQLEAMQGNFDSARNLIAQGKALAEELGLVWMLVGGIPIQAAYIELLAGDASAAERELRPAWEALERLGSWGDFVAFAYRLADALFLQRRDDEALRLTELAEGRAPRQDVETAIGWRRVRAKVLARRGEPAEGERLAREAIALAARTDYLHYHAQAVADLAEVLRLSGRSKESAAVAKEAIRLYEKKGNIVAARALRGFLAELAGV